MLRIGPHISKAETPNLQRQEARSYGWGIIQTHAGNPKTLSLDPNKVSTLASDSQRDILWVVHAAYPAFFVPPDRTASANAAYMMNLAKWCQRAGAQFAVMHLGATKDRDPKEVVEAAKRYWVQRTELHSFLRQHSIKFLIENVAAAYDTNRDLNHIISVTKETPDILGWCLDTAHSNAAGVHYDVLAQIVVDPERMPDVIHCNYPGSAFGSGHDRHGWL